MKRNWRNSIQDVRNLAKLWPYIRPWRRHVLAACLLIPMILLVASAIPLVIKYAVDEGMLGGSEKVLLVAALIFFGLVVLEYGLRMAQTMLMATAVHRMIKDLRATLVRHVLKLSSRYHDKTMSGSLVTRATSDFDNLSESLNHGILTAAVDIAVVVGALIGIFVLHAQLALVVLLILPVVILFIVVASSAMKATMLQARTKIASLNAFTQECLMGMSTVKLLNAEDSATLAVKSKAFEYRDAQMKTVILDATMFAVLDGAASITIGIVLWLVVSPYFAAWGITPVSAGVLVAFVSYLGNVFEPLKQLGGKMAMMQGALTAIDRVFSVLETKDFVGGLKPVNSIGGTLIFRDVCFRYSDADSKPVLDGINLSVPAGASLAIVGQTGSGKSTIIRLIAKLYDGYQGCIELDGQSLADLDPHMLRQRIAIVPQDITLFDGTISYNISLGLAEISEDQIISSAKLVGAHEFIEALPGKYNYQISTASSSLSHGQKQLIAFARALAKNPELMILDEATSSVDQASEALIQKAINKIMSLKKQTLIIIAHRLSTIKSCDEILVLHHGKVLERGNHHQLMEAEGSYASMMKTFAQSV